MILVHLNSWQINRGALCGGTRMELVATTPALLPEWYVRRRTRAHAARTIKPCPVPDLPLDTVTKTRHGRTTVWKFAYEHPSTSVMLL